MPCKEERGLLMGIVVISPNELPIYLRAPHTRLPGSLLPLPAEPTEFLKWGLFFHKIHPSPYSRIILKRTK
jgi:hypothetical protein